MRQLFLALGLCVLFTAFGHGADFADPVAEQIEAATAEFQQMKTEVRNLLVAATQRASNPQALAEAVAALEMFDTHKCISAESPDKVRSLYKSARNAYLRKLQLIQRTALNPQDKTRIAEMAAALQAEQRFDLCGIWEMRSSGLPKGVRRLYQFSERQNHFAFTVEGDPDLRESTGTVQWNNEWTALAGESITLFEDDRSQKRRSGKVAFQVIDANTLRGTHTRFYWDSDGKEIKRESYTSTLKRAGGADAKRSP